MYLPYGVCMTNLLFVSGREAKPVLRYVSGHSLHLAQHVGPSLAQAKIVNKTQFLSMYNFDSDFEHM